MTLDQATSGPVPARPTVDDLHPDQSSALRALADATQRFNLAVATTHVDAERLREATDALERLTGDLEEVRRARCLRGSFDGPQRAVETGEPYRVCAYNPWGVPLDIALTRDRATATLAANALHEGPPDSVHGGVGAWLMDSLLGLLMQAQGRRAVTARLDLRYRARTPLDRPLALEARLTRRDGRKTWIEGWIEHDGRRTLEAEGLFVEVAAS